MCGLSSYLQRKATDTTATIVSDRDGAIDRKLYPLVWVNLVAIANNQSPESVRVSV